MRVLLVPGRSPAGPKHWLTLWAADHPEYAWVRRRDTPDTDLDDRIVALDAAVGADPEPAVLVATSLGCVTVARWACAAAPESTARVAGALLTVPPDVDDLLPKQPLPFRSILVGSRDDVHMSYPRAQALAGIWGAEFVDGGAVGHLNTASGYGPWPAGEHLLARLLAHDQGQ